MSRRPIAPSTVRRERRLRILAVLAAALAALGTAAWLARSPGAAPPQTVAVRSRAAAQDDLAPLGVTQVSPDGQYVAMTALETGGRQTLWVRRVDAVALRRLDGITNFLDARPFWSPRQPVDCLCRRPGAEAVGGQWRCTAGHLLAREAGRNSAARR